MDIRRYTNQIITVYKDVEYDVNGNAVETNPYTVKARVALKQDTIRTTNGGEEKIDGNVKTAPNDVFQVDQRLDYAGVSYRVSYVYEVVDLRGNKTHNKYFIKRV